MKHCGTQELETGRLVLRRLSVDDSEMMFNNWSSDPEVTRYLRWNAHRTWAETAELLNEWEKHYPDPAYYQWGIVEKRSGVLFGTISVFSAVDMKTGWHLNTERLGPTWEVALPWAANGGIRAMPPRPCVPCGTTGSARWAGCGWPPATPTTTLPAAPCCKRQALCTTTTLPTTSLTVRRCPAGRTT